MIPPFVTLLVPPPPFWVSCLAFLSPRDVRLPTRSLYFLACLGANHATNERTNERNEQAQYDWRFGYDAKRVKGLVDFQIYTDDLAKEMGVLPPLMKIFFQKPKLWMSIMFGPVSPIMSAAV